MDNKNEKYRCNNFVCYLLGGRGRDGWVISKDHTHTTGPQKGSWSRLIKVYTSNMIAERRHGKERLRATRSIKSLQTAKINLRATAGSSSEEKRGSHLVACLGPCQCDTIRYDTTAGWDEFRRRGDLRYALRDARCDIQSHYSESVLEGFLRQLVVLRGSVVGLHQQWQIPGTPKLGNNPDNPIQQPCTQSLMPTLVLCRAWLGTKRVVPKASLLASRAHPIGEYMGYQITYMQLLSSPTAFSEWMHSKREQPA